MLDDADKSATADDESGYYQFGTYIRKQLDATQALNFDVTLRRFPYDSDIPGPSVATLSGFLIQPGYIPDGDSDIFDHFDMRSGHAAMAFHILTDDAALVDKALTKDRYALDDLGAVAYLERLWVHTGLRGRGIGQRLLREAQHVLSRSGLLVMVKAHPDDGGEAADCIKLASYYQSESRLRLRTVSKRKHPGWLVGVWDDSACYPDDEPTFFEEVGPLPFEKDPHE
jgi:ribosomal protein S18 acetylase RimI-like enzyme